MAKSKPKIQKRLAKLVLAALLCTGGVQTLISPSVVEANSNEVVYGTVTKDGVTRKVTNVNSDYHGYYLSGDAPMLMKSPGEIRGAFLESKQLLLVMTSP